jgi:hypothetical protein
MIERWLASHATLHPRFRPAVTSVGPHNTPAYFFTHQQWATFLDEVRDGAFTVV